MDYSSATSTSTLPKVVLSVVAVLTFAFLRSRGKRTGALPPGPKPLPIIGNAFELVTKELWVKASGWAKTYGDVVYVHVFGQGLLFVNSYEAAFDLMEKKGSIYSDKPHLVMAGELCGCENMAMLPQVAFTRYGDQSRRQRRLMTKALGPQAIPAYNPLLEIETQALLKRVMDEPEKFQEHTRRYAGGLTLLVVYGYRVTSNDDPMITLAEECVDILTNRIGEGLGLWMVDVFPFLKYLPAWFPGAGFKRKGKAWKAKMVELVDKPYEHVKARMSEGTATPCFCTKLLEQTSDGDADVEEKAQQDFDIRWTANSMYAASIDTTITVLAHFFLMMMLHPDVQKKAQAEIDSTVGTDRLPTFYDRPSLPYVDAIMSEVLRWGAPVPLGLGHRLMEDDVYKGMYIPGGTFIMGNVWNMCRNPELFPDPDAFVPERYMEKVDDTTAHKRDPRNAVFGFGRRRCPGAHLVESSLWIVIASFLAAFDIKKPVDDQGKIVEPSIVFDNPLFRTPNPFPCDIKPRSARASELIRQEANTA
ncbi:cytochrome P450 [Daedaleopsis nitida]|nr:cytochrome P450 [Daedaleopsis nitida]